MKPNIFDYATSELSQDAFLAWFFQWAAEDNKKIDSKLQKCAENALREFFGNVNLPQKINSIYADTQYKHIDLWITVNDDYHLIIEDKTKTSMHDNQLQRYCHA